MDEATFHKTREKKINVRLRLKLLNSNLEGITIPEQLRMILKYVVMPAFNNRNILKRQKETKQRDLVPVSKVVIF